MNGDDFPDALSGGPFAYRKDATIQLVKADSIPAETAQLSRRQLRDDHEHLRGWRHVRHQ